MPFKSGKQRKWMFANEPEMAKRWAKHEGDDMKAPRMTEIFKINETGMGMDSTSMSNLKQQFNTAKPTSAGQIAQDAQDAATMQKNVAQGLQKTQGAKVLKAAPTAKELQPATFVKNKDNSVSMVNKDGTMMAMPGFGQGGLSNK